jgi:hypothetical protein
VVVCLCFGAEIEYPHALKDDLLIVCLLACLFLLLRLLSSVHEFTVARVPSLYTSEDRGQVNVSFYGKHNQPAREILKALMPGE